MEGKKALIAGASGLIGRHCLDAILAHGGYAHVVALVRESLNRTHPILEERVIDFDRLSGLTDGFPMVDDVFCCLGMPMRSLFRHRDLIRVDYKYPRKIAALALRMGANHFSLVTSGGIGPKSPIYYCRVKSRVENAINALPYRSVHLFRPSFLIDRPFAEGPIQWLIGKMIGPFTPLFVGPAASVRPLAGEAVGTVMVAGAERKEPGRRLWTSGEIQARRRKIEEESRGYSI